jgi:hypothetical protein
MASGIGRGRDALAFARHGGLGVAFGGSAFMVRQARAHVSDQAGVHNLRFQGPWWQSVFDGVWTGRSGGVLPQRCGPAAPDTGRSSWGRCSASPGAPVRGSNRRHPAYRHGGHSCRDCDDMAIARHAIQSPAQTVAECDRRTGNGRAHRLRHHGQRCRPARALMTLPPAGSCPDDEIPQSFQVKPGMITCPER